MKGIMGFVFIVIGIAMLAGSCNCGTGGAYYGGHRHTTVIHRRRPMFGGVFVRRPVTRVGVFSGGSRRSSFGGSRRSSGSFGK